MGRPSRFARSPRIKNPWITLVYGMTPDAVLKELQRVGSGSRMPVRGTQSTPRGAHGRRIEAGTGMSEGTSGLKVMVVDDSKTIRRTAETLLKKEGYEVVTATDGFDALSKIADTKPAIIFVDIMMPRLDGYQTCALIKNNSEFKSTPVVMLSSKDGLFDKAKGRIVGSDQYLTKPFSRDELIGAIEKLVSA
jgi:twitching motility two-component system response regulator PilG